MNPLDLLSVLASLISGELAQARRISALDPIFTHLHSLTQIGNGALGTDSLDLLMLSGAVAEMFHLHETGMDKHLLRTRTLEGWSEIVAASLKERPERITFRTSGSTGTPKRCVHSLQHLQEEAVEHANTFCNCRRVLSMIPSHHIYGFIWTVLVPARLGIPRLDVRRWSPAQIASEAQGKDLLVGVPANWKWLGPVFDLLPPGVFGVTSGAPCAPDLFTRIQAAGVNLFEIYGSSETGGVGRRRDAAAPFTLLPFWERDKSTSQTAQNALIRSNSFTVLAPDELLWETDRLFRTGFRTDGAFQIRGRNVFPERVAEVVRAYPAVEDCAVRAMRPEEGHRLKAFVVWRPGSSLMECSEERLAEWLEGKLQPHERPASFTFGLAVPVDAMNKSTDW